MYFVNREQIAVRLDSIAELATAMEMLAVNWQGTVLEGLAQERALHLAIETVTDIGSFLIDGFILRDASSYEDIIEITGEAGAFPLEMQAVLTELVMLRKPLVQDYYVWQRSELQPLTKTLSTLLPAFKKSIEDYLEREL
ncbi:hypothetical protein BK133_28555 [Paenibacillus sp. FSL H8-0548]|uniref:DUF86 domain-containing protein n=1 Tax=Paenibacillus sp. FSL H8-0548 TaxID=1920422 RepID=UPI00096C3D63|nr:HepT-like ribonuclease domain-containing protein [Paenibacillus sp. FSL H8-0548]OMF21332.1 hypothetical protein BK133_28555 [Paenibacillus sp. FSL H8-0548]